MRLLVDSGFTGESSFVLPRRAANLMQALVARSEIAGALTGYKIVDGWYAVFQSSRLKR